MSDYIDKILMSEKDRSKLKANRDLFNTMRRGAPPEEILPLDPNRVKSNVQHIEGGDVEAAIMQQYAKAGKVPPLEKAVAKKVLDKGKKSSKPTNWKGISQGVAAGLIGAAEAAAEEKAAAEEHNRGILTDQMSLRADASRARGRALSGLQRAFAQLIR